MLEGREVWSQESSSVNEARIVARRELRVDPAPYTLVSGDVAGAALYFWKDTMTQLAHLGKNGTNVRRDLDKRLDANWALWFHRRLLVDGVSTIVPPWAVFECCAPCVCL